MLGAAVTFQAVGRDIVQAVDSLSAWTQRAAALGASFVLFPEVALGDYFGGPVTVEGPEISSLRSLAEDLHVRIGLGLGECDGSARYSSYALLGGRGHVAVHRKTRWQTARCPINLGTALEAHDLCGCQAGIAICSEVREPTVSQELAAQGARILLVPMAMGRALFPDGRTEGPSFSDFVYQHLVGVSRATGLALVAIGAVGTRSDLEVPQPHKDVLHGGLALINSEGRVVSCREAETEELFTFDLHWEGAVGSVCVLA